MSKPELDVFRCVVSGHQPTLFGSAGYWSKMTAGDFHIASAGVPFRRGDHLGRLELGMGSLSVGLLQASTIALVEVESDLTKIIRAVRQTYGARRNPYRDRLDPIVRALEFTGSRWFMDLWERLVDAHCQASGLDPSLLVANELALGSDTHDKLLNRIARVTPECDAYIIGPGGLDYLRPDDRRGRRFFVHRMTEPSPVPFLHAIVTERDPLECLENYTLEEIK